MKHKAYPVYKDSGVKWLGKIPVGWDEIALSRILECPITDGPHSTPQFIGEGVPFLSVDGIQDGELVFDGCRFVSHQDHLEFTKKAAPKRNDILMGKAASIGKIARVQTDIEFSIWSPLALIRTDKTACHATYVEYALKSPEFQAQITQKANANTQFNIGMKDIPKLRLCRPSMAEQSAIAAFLDRETGKIDTLVSKQERLIDLLQEKRQATISHAVTKGLNRDAPMGDSGVEWLGEVPDHWEVVGLTKYLESLIDYRGKTPTKTDDGVFLVTARNIGNGVLDYSVSAEYVAPSEYKEIMRRGNPAIGDVLFTTEAPLGEVANVDRVDIALAQRIIKFRGKNEILDNYYLKYWIMGSSCQADIAQLATGSTALGIKGSKVGKIRLCLPPINEQQQIVKFVDAETAKIDLIVEKCIKAIALLRERRSALISAAVTGKIDVRDEAAGEAA